MPWVYEASPEVNDISEYPAIVGVSVSLTVLTIILTVLRAYVRVFIVKSPGIDDYVTFATSITNIIYNALVVYQTRLGLGLPVKLRPQSLSAKYDLVNFVGRPLYMLGVTGFKIALCFAYLRFTSGAVHKFRMVVWSAMVFIIVAQSTSTLVIILQCKPVAKSWEPYLQGSCLAIYPTWNATAAITIFCDVVTFLLPIPLFARLQIDLRRKFGLIILFALGLFTTVCSVMRMVQIKTIAKDGNNSGLVLWAAAELNVGISLSCLPTVLPVLRFFTKLFRTGMTSYQSPPIKLGEISLPHNCNDLNRSGSQETILPKNMGNGDIMKTVTFSVNKPAGDDYNTCS